MDLVVIGRNNVIEWNSELELNVLGNNNLFDERHHVRRSDWELKLWRAGMYHAYIVIIIFIAINIHFWYRI